MDRLSLWGAAALAIFVMVLGEPSSAAADDNDDTGIVTLSAADLEDGAILLEDWRYRAGDDPSWCRPELDDASWEPLPTAWLEETPASGWDGIGWFRLRLRRSPDLDGKILGLSLRQRGASEVYLDCQLLVSYGQVASDPADEIAHWPPDTQLLPIYDTEEHVLAVRYSNASETRRPGSDRLGFVGFITDLEGNLERLYTHLGGRAGRWKLWVGAALAFALLHVCLFAFRPLERSNLYFAIAAAGFAGLVGFMGLEDYESNPLWAVLFTKAAFANGVVMLMGFACFNELYFENKWSWMLRLELMLGLLALVWTAVSGTPTAFYSYAFVVVATMVPGATSIKRKDAGNRILTLGFLVVGGTGIAQVLNALGWLGRVDREIYPYGMLFLFISISISLAHHLATTHRELEQQLVQVRELSEQALEQEQESRQREIERRLLEVDNARKTEELEEARKLQLSLLPEQRPRIPGVEVGFTMQPATEIGGDYYDFVESDGTLTLALGDATGHGLQAGMLAMSAKSLFQTASGRTNIADVLDTIARGIDAMQLGRMNMALALIRYDVGRWQLTSAGMPPFLCYRAASHRVEEIELPAPPLGTISGHEYGVAEVVLEPGDLLLGMTDGLPETLDPNDGMLGYAALKPLLAELAEKPLDEILQGFLDAAQQWAAGRSPEDDLTLLVARRVKHGDE
ncbi:MAG: SpoIIE family protein phosphatase [Acidobacteriota bacterium]